MREKKKCKRKNEKKSFAVERVESSEKRRLSAFSTSSFAQSHTALEGSVSQEQGAWLSFSPSSLWPGAKERKKKRKKLDDDVDRPFFVFLLVFACRKEKKKIHSKKQKKGVTFRLVSYFFEKPTARVDNAPCSLAEFRTREGRRLQEEEAAGRKH